MRYVTPHADSKQVCVRVFNPTERGKHPESVQFRPVLYCIIIRFILYRNIMKDSYEQAWDGEWFDAPQYIACCDCGLVHKIKLRKIKGRYQMLVWRDNRRTGQRRRRIKLEGK